MCDNKSAEWKTCYLSNKCNLSGGYGFPDKLQGSLTSELPFIKVSDMNLDGNEKYIVHSNNYVTRQLAEKMRWSPFPVNTVVFAKVGAALKLNRRRILSKPILIDNNMMAAEALPGLDAVFLYHFLATVDFSDFVQDGALPSINQNQVGSLKIPDIQLTEQQTIATILDTMDETIRQTEAVIAKLRQVKVGMLHDLLTFGLDENGELRDPIRNPEQFKNSPLGRIPNEWDIVNVGVLANFQNGHCFNSQDWKRNGLPIIRIQNLNENTDFNYYQGPVQDDWHIYPGDLLFAWAGQRGSSFGPRIWRGPEAVLNQHIFKVIPRLDLVSKNFLNILLNVNLTRIEDCAHGFKQSFLHVPKCDLVAVQVSLPGLREQSLIEEKLLLLENRTEKNLALSSKFMKIKQGLMHDLLTGEVRVPPHLLEAMA